jgi:hypothetical protein
VAVSGPKIGVEETRVVYRKLIWLFLIFPCLAIGLTEVSGQVAPKSSPVIVVDEEKDTLPGAKLSPSRKEIEELIRAVGRDPVSEALIDRVDALFRPRCTLASKFENVKKKAVDAAYVAKIEAIVLELTKKPADTRTLIRTMISYPIVDGTNTTRTQLKADLERESKPGKTIKGRILDDATAKPIQGAIVSTPAGVMSRTDAKGDFVLETREPQAMAKFIVSVEAPGFALSQTILDWSSMENPDVHDFRLLPALLFGGHVVDPQGKPIEGVEAVLWVQLPATVRDESNVKHGYNAYSQFTAKTDADGIFVFHNLPPDNGTQQWAFQMTIRHPKYQGRMKRYMPNELLGDGWEITMEPGATVRGVVVDEAGKPVADAHVMVRINVAGTVPQTQTDAEGKFRLDELVPGPVDVQVQPKEHLYTTAVGQAAVGDPAEMKITVGKGEFFEGKVLGSDGKPLTGAYVGYPQPVDDKGEVLPQDRNLINRQVTTGPDGKFRFGPVPKGRYRLRAIYSGKGGNANAYESAEAGSKNVVFRFAVIGD